MSHVDHLAHAIVENGAAQTMFAQAPAPYMEVDITRPLMIRGLDSMETVAM